jgi:hypothetical protein
VCILMRFVVCSVSNQKQLWEQWQIMLKWLALYIFTQIPSYFHTLIHFLSVINAGQSARVANLWGHRVHTMVIITLSEIYNIITYTYYTRLTCICHATYKQLMYRYTRSLEQHIRCHSMTSQWRKANILTLTMYVHLYVYP